ncbi:MAG TPA: alpha/beta fold hydrolase [Pyrinomonadaceae bacterium]|nr:alpha/beta fold hydrolase [Pyrinomonadaceae bacterium]
MSVMRVRGIELAYEVEGSGSPVVLLHGFPFNRSLWGEQVAELRARHRVITPDLRGLGESPPPDDEAATMDEMARDVAALMDELRATRAVVAGLSMGGYVALSFQRMFSHRVRALVLADTRATPDTEEQKQAREEMARKALDEGAEAVGEAMLPKLLAPRTLAERPETVARLRAMMRKQKRRGVAAALRGMALRRDHTPFLQNVLAPTLVVVGSEDALTPPTDAELLRREIRGSRLVKLEGAGHVSNLEAPEEFNRALLAFLKDLEP